MSDTEDQGNGTANQSPSTEMQKQELEVLKARAKMMGLTFSNNIGLEALRKKVNDKMSENEGVSGEGGGHDDDDPVFEDDNASQNDGAGEQAQQQPQQGTDVQQDASSTSNTTANFSAADQAQLQALLEKQRQANGGVSKVNALTGEVQAAAGTPVKRKTLRQHLHDEEMKLVRVRIACLDPKKKDLQGEILTVANEYLGTVRKFVPYGDATDDGFHIPMCIYRFMEARKFQNIRTVKDRRTGQIRVDSSWQKEYALEVLPQLTEDEINRLALAQTAAGSVDG